MYSGESHHFEQDDVEVSAFRKENQIQILLYRQMMVEGSGIQPVTLVIENIPSVKAVTVQAIDDAHCNPIRVWEEMGKPAPLKPGEVDFIKGKSRMTEENMPFEFDNDGLQIHTSIGCNDIKLITVTL